MTAWHDSYQLRQSQHFTVQQPGYQIFDLGKKNGDEASVEHKSTRIISPVKISAIKPGLH